MINVKKIWVGLCLLYSACLWSVPNTTELSVWANEAIVATYTYDYANFVPRQREIAKYFTAAAWANYLKAFGEAGLMDAVTKNAYYVSAVAQLPPVIKTTGVGQWQASMPLLILYKNPQFQQKQILQVEISFSTAPAGQGVRGMSIKNLQSKTIKAPCVCKTANP